MVLADGTKVHASADENPELFWALRGGGGNFGVVTEFQFRTHPVGSTVIAGPTMWPIEQLPEVLRCTASSSRRAARGERLLRDADRAARADFPEELHLKKVCAVVWCLVGVSEEDATALLAPALEVGTPLLHGVGSPCRTPRCRAMFDPLYPKGLQCYWRGDVVTEITDELIDTHLEWSSKLPTMLSTMHLYPIDGAVRDVGEDETPFSYRQGGWAGVVFAVDPDPAKADELRDWCIGYWDAAHPYSAGGAYVNFMGEGEGQDRVRATYRGNYDRLAKREGAVRPDERVPDQPERDPGARPDPLTDARAAATAARAIRVRRG